MATEDLPLPVVFPTTTSTDLFDLKENIEKLISMGFTNEQLNRQILTATRNGILEAVTVLCDPNYTYDETVVSDTPTTATSTEEEDMIVFDRTAFLNLEANVNADHWPNSHQRDGNLARCLVSATKLIRLGIAEQDEDCQKFMEITIPNVFEKLHRGSFNYSWSLEIQLGILEMTELLIDLIAARLSYSPIPIQLLQTLAIVFSPYSSFQGRNSTMPYARLLYDQQFGKCLLAEPSLEFALHIRNESYGWLCQLINRFVIKNGVENLKKHFKSQQPLSAFEYNILLRPFFTCMKCIIVKSFRRLFSEEIKQVLDYVKNFKEEDFQAETINSTIELPCILREIFFYISPDRLGQVDELHLNLLLKMLSLTNFDAKSIVLQQLSQIIDSSQSYPLRMSKTSIPYNVIRKWIIEYSILEKALEGDIQQEQYKNNIQRLIRFIILDLSKQHIETIWKIQTRRSSADIDHFFELIAYAAIRFNIEQVNYLLELIYKSWKTETDLIKEKLIELLGAIGRKCETELAVHVLETLWNMGHEFNLSRSTLDRILNCHLSIFIEGRSLYIELKRDYCLKCLIDIQNKQDWVVPAIKYLHELLSQNLTNIFDMAEYNLSSLLINKHDLIGMLIQNLSMSQLAIWNRTQGIITKETLLDDHFTYEESVRIHLDLLSFLLKKSNLYLILQRAEQLWDTLITNENISIDNLNYNSQKMLFEKRISKLDSVHLSSNGLVCFKLYAERYAQSTSTNA